MASSRSLAQYFFFFALCSVYTEKRGRWSVIPADRCRCSSYTRSNEAGFTVACLTKKKILFKTAQRVFCCRLRLFAQQVRIPVFSLLKKAGRRQRKKKKCAPSYSHAASSRSIVWMCLCGFLCFYFPYFMEWKAISREWFIFDFLVRPGEFYFLNARTTPEYKKRCRTLRKIKTYFW